jgi:hypothetical protein
MSTLYEAKWAVRATVALLAVTAGACVAIAYQTGQILVTQRKVRELVETQTDHLLVPGATHQHSHWPDQ